MNGCVICRDGQVCPHRPDTVHPNDVYYGAAVKDRTEHLTDEERDSRYDNWRRATTVRTEPDLPGHAQQDPVPVRPGHPYNTLVVVPCSCGQQLAGPTGAGISDRLAARIFDAHIRQARAQKAAA